MLVQVLTVTHESAGWFSDALRSVFWFLAKGALLLLDGLFLIIDDIWKFKFFDNTYVNKIYSAAIIIACTWLILKVIIEFITHHIINQDSNTSPLSIFKGIIISIVMMFLIPYLFTWGYNISTKLTEYVVAASSSAETSPTGFESTMSSMILTAFADDSQMNEADKTYFVENWFTADYNDVIDDGLFDSGKYIYSFSMFPIFLTGLVVAILLFFIGIQVAKRVIELALYKSIAPFVCTSLISQRSSRSFEIWTKGVIGTFLVTTVQYLCIGILFNVFGQVAQGTTYVMSIILIVIGALLFIISSPSLVTTLLNANTGTLSNMNELSTLMAVGTSMVAMSKYGKTSDSSTTNNQNNDNSTNGGDNSTGGETNTGPDINSNGTSNLQSTSDNTIEDNTNNANNNFSSSSDISPSPSDNNNINYSDFQTAEITTPLNDRIDIYKDMTDTNYNINNNSNLYKTNIDWGNSNVFNTKEHKS